MTLAEPLLSSARTLDVVEMFSGDGELSAACLRKGLLVQSIDRENGPLQDLGTMVGLQFAIDAIMNLKVGGLLWLAPPCQNWVFLSMSVHRRSATNDYLGRPSSRLTQEANSLLYINTALVRLAVARGAKYIIEQPLDSRMLKTKCMAKVFHMTGARRVVTYLKSFAETFPCAKGLHLAGNADFLQALVRNRPEGKASDGIYTIDSITGSVTGGPELAGTASYPSGFGEAAQALLLPERAFSCWLRWYVHS